MVGWCVGWPLLVSWLVEKGNPLNPTGNHTPYKPILLLLLLLPRSLKERSVQSKRTRVANEDNTSEPLTARAAQGQPVGEEHQRPQRLGEEHQRPAPLGEEQQRLGKEPGLGGTGEERQPGSKGCLRGLGEDCGCASHLKVEQVQAELKQ